MHNDLIGEFEEYKITKDIGLLWKQNMMVLMPQGCEFNTQIWHVQDANRCDNAWASKYDFK